MNIISSVTYLLFPSLLSIISFSSPSDCKKLQDDLSCASSWCDSWMVTIKSEKCKVLHTSKSKNPLLHQYDLCNPIMSAVKKHKHLGVWIVPSLSRECRANSICAKANRVLGLIRRTFGSKDPIGVELHLMLWCAQSLSTPVQCGILTWQNMSTDWNQINGLQLV